MTPGRSYRSRTNSRDLSSCIIDVLREEATEDIQKIGGTEALDAPYLQIPLTQMINAPDGLQLCLLGKCSRPRRWVITKIRFHEPLSLLCSFR
jgi:hypothetical protein